MSTEQNQKAQIQKEQSYRERRLERACRYVSDLWIPVNPELLGKIKAGLAAGRYVEDRQALVSELKSDVGLFMHCVRELSHQISRAANLEPTNPVALIEKANLEELQNILNISDHQLSRHNISGMNDLQARRFQETLLSATTTEVLCAEEDLDPAVGFSTAILRQLGLTLIAWNYPGLYERAIRTITAENPLDDVLTTMLGYSPTMLAIRLSRRWGIAESMVATIGDDATSTEDEDSDRAEYAQLLTVAAGTYGTICKVGEALARANQPDIYPTATSDWHEARGAVEERLGAFGIQQIQEHFTRACENYVDAVPTVFKGGIVLNPESKIRTHRQATLIDRNTWASNSHPDIKKQIVALYRSLSASGSISEAHVVALTRDIVPKAGFTGGCIFTIDPGTLRLFPQLRFGAPITRTIEPVSCSTFSDPLIKAFETLDIQRQEHPGTGDATTVALYHVVGYSQRVGVIMLEIPRNLFQINPNQHLTHAKALIQALNDCLQLS